MMGKKKFGDMMSEYSSGSKYTAKGKKKKSRNKKQEIASSALLRMRNM
jgi:hypothetical protein